VLAAESALVGFDEWSCWQAGIWQGGSRHTFTTHFFTLTNNIKTEIIA
jgi:hypothetical protein